MLHYKPLFVLIGILVFFVAVLFYICVFINEYLMFLIN